MAILDTGFYKDLFSPLTDKRIAFVPLLGNVGDHLSHQATEQLFDHFNIDYKKLPCLNIDYDSLVGSFDEIVVSGGGNMGGSLYIHPYDVRQKLITTGLPITIFPQSFIQNEENLSHYTSVYVREKQSQRLNSNLILAPDLALGYLGELDYPEPEYPLGLFLREDGERELDLHPASLGDPAHLSMLVEEYFDLASRFEHIVTDRLHFGIAALLLNRKLTLLPNSYFKNRAMYETWLSELAEWRDDVNGLELKVPNLSPKLIYRLSGAPSQVLRENQIPVREPGYFLRQVGNNQHITHANGCVDIQSNINGAMIWQLCDGEHSVGNIVELICDAFHEQRLFVAKNIQQTLNQLLTYQAITARSPCAYSTNEPSKPNNLMNISSRQPICVEVLQPMLVDGQYRVRAKIDNDECWFAVNSNQQSMMTSAADPFVLIALARAMREDRSIIVSKAPVSNGLLRNLEQFQTVWTTWRALLHKVDIVAESGENTLTQASGSIAAFSGGVDSCYTIYRNLIEKDSKWGPDIKAAVLIHGFDFEANNQEKFQLCFDNAQELLDDLDVELLSVQTNSREFLPDWLDTHGLLLAASLSLFSARYESGVIASTLPYDILAPLGSNPTSDWMMGSDAFPIIHHGAESSRLSKIKAIVNWPIVHKNLRVCWESSSQNIINCGECLACSLTAIMFHTLGHYPVCFPNNITAEMTRRLLDRNLGRLEWYDLNTIVQEAESQSLEFSWLPVIKEAIARNTAITVAE